MRIQLLLLTLLTACTGQISGDPIQTDAGPQVTSGPSVCDLFVFEPRSITALGSRSDTAVVTTIPEYIPDGCAPFNYHCADNLLRLTCEDHTEEWKITGGDSARGFQVDLKVTDGSVTSDSSLLVGVAERDNIN